MRLSNRENPSAENVIDKHLALCQDLASVVGLNEEEINTKLKLILPTFECNIDQIATQLADSLNEDLEASESSN